MDSSPSMTPDSTSRSVPVIVYVFVALGCLALFGAGALLIYAAQFLHLTGTSFSQPIEPRSERALEWDQQPTAFSRVGTVGFTGPQEHPRGTPYLTFETASGTQETVKMVFDEESTCVFPDAEIACVAMNVTFTSLMDGRESLVAGTREGTNLLVRRMYLTRR